MIRRWIKKYLGEIIIEVLKEKEVNIANNTELKVIEVLKNILADPQ